MLGEGEETILELIRAFEKGTDVRGIKGLAYRSEGKTIQTNPRDPVTDFDRWPLPNFSLVRYANIKIYPIGRIRGCGMDCEFCSVRGKLRCASPERMLESISFLVETQNARQFFVVDDLFGQQRGETLKFCQLLIDYKKRIRKRLWLMVQIRLDKAKDKELLTAMYDAGVRVVAIGFESPIDEELKVMSKRINPEEMLSFTRVFHKSGFLVHGMFIFGYPMKGEAKFVMTSKERVERFKTFIKKAKLDTIQVLLPIPLPGTLLRDRLVAQNRVYSIRDVGWEYYDGNFPLFEPDEPMSPEEMHHSVRKIMSRFYQFKYMFLIGLNVFSFPALVLFLHDIKSGWRKWYRPWRNYLARFGGWIIMRKWISAFEKEAFSKKLQKAKEHLKSA